MTEIIEADYATDGDSSTKYRYWAFISYAHYDARIAQSLKRRLSGMRVPAELRNTVSTRGSHFSDVFLDVHDAGADRSVTAELEEALAASRYLIVICSPVSRSSYYVNEEIRYFQRTGRSQDILCFVGYGVPGAAATGQQSLECLPAALDDDKGMQPLAAVIGGESEQEWALAVEKIAAGLSGRSLKDYHLAINWQKTRRLAIGSLGFAILLLFAYALSWAYYLPHISYATSYARANGVWIPIKPVSADRAVRLDQKFRFISSGAFGRLRRVELVNRFDRCEGPLDSITGDAFSPSCSNVRVCAAEFSYVAGQVKEEKLVDQYGNAVETLNYLRPSTAAISEAIIGCTFRPGTIAVVKFERFQSGKFAGYDKKLTFWGLGGTTPAPNSDFAYGFSFEYSDSGETTRVTSLDRDGLPKVSRKGYAYKIRASSNKEISEAYFDPSGKPVVSNKGFHRQVERLDTHGDVAGVAYFDTAGISTNGPEGFHRYGVEWLAAGRESLVRFFDAKGAPTRSKYGSAAVRRKYDSAGNEIETRYYDSAGHLVIGGSRNCAIQKATYNTQSGQETDSCFDQEERPAFDRHGVHTDVRTYNDKGQAQEVRHVGLNNTPVFCNDNGKETGCPVYRMVNEFDEAGNRIRVRFHGPDGSLSANGEGLAGWNSTFAPTGLELRRMGVGVDGKPSPNKEGVVVTEFKYDHMSRLISQRYLSVDGGAVPNSRGVHEYVAEFADDDKARLEKALDNKGKTIRDESGIGVYKSTYDELGRVHTTRFFDVDSVTPVAERDGWFGIMRDYDAYGNLVKTGRLSRSGDLEATAGGLAGYVQEFDSIGRVIAISSVGKFGESVSNSAGVFTTRHTYSLGDMVASTKTYNIAGKPTVDQNGIASTVSEIDSRGQVRKISWYGTDGVPQGFPANPSITSITKAYDERGRQVTEFFFDKNGKAASNANGRFGVRFIYDSKNQVIEEINLDANGLPLDTDSFPARTKFAYDAYGRDVLVQQLRADGAQPLSGVPLIIRVEYDSYGRRTKRQFEDSNGIVLHRASGRAIVRYQYDDFGRIVSERSYDARDSLVDRKDVHWATRTFTYNEFGEQSAKCMSALGRSIVPCGRDD